VGWSKSYFLLCKNKRDLKIASRNGKTITHRYPELTEAVNQLINCKESIILDGEILALNNKGQPDFQSHQTRMNLDSIKDIVFDLDPCIYGDKKEDQVRKKGLGQK
jgi:bifunctional non-homologous end joining protein LigD